MRRISKIRPKSLIKGLKVKMLEYRQHLKTFPSISGYVNWKYTNSPGVFASGRA